MSKLIILTLSWEGRDKLETLYPTLINSLENINYEWYIKDNGSKDNTIELEKIWKNENVHIIQYPHNRDNFSQGCNLLFKEASPDPEDLILLLNNDIIFNDTTSLTNMIGILNNDENIGVVGARLIYKGTNTLQHAGVVFVPRYNTPTHFRAGQIVDENSKRNREFQAVTGAVLLTKAKYYQNVFTDNKSKINGLCENLVWAFDDIDLSLAIHVNMKKKIVYCGTNIFHEESASLKKNPINKMFLTHNLQYFLNKWRGKYIIDSDIYNKDPNHKLYLK
jgi:GT2 family glycosyltransferase